MYRTDKDNLIIIVENKTTTPNRKEYLLSIAKYAFRVFKFLLIVSLIHSSIRLGMLSEVNMFDFVFSCFGLVGSLTLLVLDSYKVCTKGLEKHGKALKISFAIACIHIIVFILVICQQMMQAERLQQYLIDVNSTTGDFFSTSSIKLN